MVDYSRFDRIGDDDDDERRRPTVTRLAPGSRVVIGPDGTRLGGPQPTAAAARVPPAVRPNPLSRALSR